MALIIFKANGHGREIGLVIDLTATNRYYDPREWIDQGIEYAKVECMGHTAHSQEDTIRRFFEIVSDFLTHNANNGIADVVSIFCISCCICFVEVAHIL